MRKSGLELRLNSIDGKLYHWSVTDRANELSGRFTVKIDSRGRGLHAATAGESIGRASEAWRRSIIRAVVRASEALDANSIL